MTIDPLILIAAVLLDLLLGDPRWLPHPVVAIGKLISLMEGWLRRIFKHKRLAGLLLLILTIGITFLVGFLFLKVAYAISPYAGFAVAAFFAYTCLATRSLHFESLAVAVAMKAGDLNEARRRLSFIVGRDTAELDEAEIWRAVIETVAENTSDGVIAPLFYLIIGGPLLAIAYKAVNTLDSMVGYKNEKYIHLGWASARFDDLLNWIPARLTGILIVLSAPLVGLSMPDSWRIMRRDGRNHSSPNSGMPEAAAAGALGVQLGGTNRYFDQTVEKPTIGEPLNALTIASYRGVVRLMYGSEIIFVAACLFLIKVFF